MHLAHEEDKNRQDQKDWETCRRLLAEIRESGEAEGLFSVEAQEKYIWQEIEREEAEKEAEAALLAESGEGEAPADSVPLTPDNLFKS